MLATVAEHVVQTRVIVPGSAHLEFSRAVVCAALPSRTTIASLGTIFFVQPLAVDKPGKLYYECTLDGGLIEVRSGHVDEGGALASSLVHCSARAAALYDWRWRVDCASVHRCHRVSAAHISTLYDGHHAIGLQYGPTYRTLEKAWGGRNKAVAQLRTRWTWQGMQVHPADLDDAQCLTAVAQAHADSGNELKAGSGNEPILPFAIDNAQLQGANGPLWAVNVAPHSKSQDHNPISHCMHM